VYIGAAHDRRRRPLGRHPRPASASDISGPDGRAGVSELRFANSSLGFAFDPQLFVTSDGGQSWRQEKLIAGSSTTVVALAATRRGTYAVTSTATGGAPFLVRAAPGSTVFTRLTSLPAGDIEPDSLVAAGSDLYLGYARDTSSSGPPQYVVDRLDGRTVTPRTVPPTTLSPCMLAASSSTALVALCGQGVGGGSMGKRALYGTAKGAATWTALPGPGQSADCSYDSEAVAATTDGHMVIAASSGGASCLVTTVNYERSWFSAFSINAEGAPWGDDLGFETATTGVAVLTNGRLYRTTEAGVRWFRVSF